MTTKILVTKQQRANALFARDVMWPSVPPENVYPKLLGWRKPKGERVTCGTVACFGGWCAVNPYFKSQGVTANPKYGYPEMPSGAVATGVARMLFGDWSLFESRESYERGTDHAIVTKRLDALIRSSVVVENAAV